ncbi:hypothetical protein [Chitinophaga lutea]|nr:hypothetical protein [Chitinophaga lutea]
MEDKTSTGNSLGTQRIFSGNDPILRLTVTTIQIFVQNPVAAKNKGKAT